MRTLTPLQRDHALAISKRPIWVVELQFTNGAATKSDGSSHEGINDFYFSTAGKSEEGLTDGIITPLPIDSRWCVFLDPLSISAVSQKLDPITGISTIGHLGFKIIDQGGYLSDIISVADSEGFGLNRQTANLFILYSGDSWDDKQLVRRMQVERVTSHNGVYTVKCSDVQRIMRKQILEVDRAVLEADVTATATSITLSGFAPSSFYFLDGVSHIKIDDECMRVISAPINSGILTFPVARQALGTAGAAHAAGSEVTEVFNFVGDPLDVALGMLTGYWNVPIGVGLPNMPDNWHCGMSVENHIDITSWQAMKTSQATSDSPFDFVFADSVDGKNFVEKEIMQVIGMFMPVKNDGTLSLSMFSELFSDAISSASSSQSDYENMVIDTDVCIRFSALNILDKGEFATTMRIGFDEYPRSGGGKLRRSALLVDEGNYKKHGKGRDLKVLSRGLIASNFASVESVMSRAARILGRYAVPPMSLTVHLLPKMYPSEIGDVFRVKLPFADPYTGADFNRCCEVVSTSITPKTGDVKLVLLSQAERVNVPSYVVPRNLQAPPPPLGAPNVNIAIDDSVFLNGLTTNAVPPDRDISVISSASLSQVIDPLDPTHLIITGTGAGHGLSSGDWYIPIDLGSPITDVTIAGVWGVYGTVRIWCNKRLLITATNINGSGRSDTTHGFGSNGGNGGNGLVTYWNEIVGTRQTRTATDILTNKSVAGTADFTPVALMVSADRTRIIGVPIKLSGSRGGLGADGTDPSFAANNPVAQEWLFSNGHALANGFAAPSQQLKSSARGIGGAGLSICARRIQFSPDARVNLSGSIGSPRNSVVQNPVFVGGLFPWDDDIIYHYEFYTGSSGGGGGGSLVCIAENEVLSGGVFINPINYNLAGNTLAGTTEGGSGVQITRVV